MKKKPMEISNNNNDTNIYLLENSTTIKDYILLIRTNLIIFITIALIIISLAAAYAKYTKDIFKSDVSLKIVEQKTNALESTNSNTEVQGLDRHVKEVIEGIGSYDTRERVAGALIDSFNNSSNKKLFSLLRSVSGKESEHKSIKEIAELLRDNVSVEQVEGTSIIEISAESHIPYEAALIINSYASQYRDLDLELNRDHLATIRHFLEKQRKEKLYELNNAEDTLKSFKEKGGIVTFDVQSDAIINQLSQLDAQYDAAKIDLMTSDEVLNQYRKEVKKKDPQLADYLHTQTSQEYVYALQKQIAELKMNLDLAVANKNPNIDVSKNINASNQRIEELKQKLDSSISDIKTSAFSTNPVQIQNLTQKLIEEEIHNHSLSIKLTELQKIIGKYEQNLSHLPKTSIELARYERRRESLKQLYLLVDQKYQEALINELSLPGNVTIMNKGRIPIEPAKPKRTLIVLIGVIIGFVAAFGFLLIKDYFDDTIKTPGDMEKNNIDFIAWISHFKNLKKNGSSRNEFIFFGEESNVSSESFKTVRSRIHFSKINPEPLKTILVTSPAEQEGKTIVSVNLAGSYAQFRKNTLLIDCDLRKPRIHSIMKDKKRPGLVDYLFNQAKLEEIIKGGIFDNFSYITSGTIPVDPTEILDSPEMKIFIEDMKKRFDIVIFDSPPLVAVIDSEILSRLVDGTILVISSNKTETELMNNAIKILKKDQVPFLGTILNNFKYKNGYGYYYKYYYHYSSNIKNHRKKRSSK